MEPAYEKGDKIIYHVEGDEAQMGIVNFVTSWKPSFCYTVEGKPNEYIQEEQIIGYEQKRQANKERILQILKKAREDWSDNTPGSP